MGEFELSCPPVRNPVELAVSSIGFLGQYQARPCGQCRQRSHRGEAWGAASRGGRPEPPLGSAGSLGTSLPTC